MCFTSFRSGCHRSGRAAAVHLPALVVDAERSWGPADARCFEVAKDGLSQVGVAASKTPGGVANTDRAIHSDGVAQPAIKATRQ